MGKRTLGLSLLVVGLVLVLLGLTADTIGLGEGSQFGYKQISALVGGAVVAAAGAYVARR